MGLLRPVRPIPSAAAAIDGSPVHTILDGGPASGSVLKSYSWHVAKVGDGGVFLRRPLLEGIVVEKF